jgi:prophage regulatory protein
MRFMRLPEIVKLTGLSRTTIWRLERDGKFPMRRTISAGAVAWVDEEVHQWANDRIQSLSTLAAGDRR